MAIEAYNMKKKEKSVMINPVIDCIGGKRFFVKGTSAEGDKLCVAIGKDKAEAAIAAKEATKGEGWN